jgi:hypothetical protein
MTGQGEASGTGDARQGAFRGGPADRSAIEGSVSAAPPHARPRLFYIGSVVDATRGSSSSGNSDANSQYYW